MDRKREVESAVTEIRAIQKRDGVTPAPGGKLKSCLYRVAEDADQVLPAHGDIREAR